MLECIVAHKAGDPATTLSQPAVAYSVKGQAYAHCLFKSLPDIQSSARQILVTVFVPLCICSSLYVTVCIVAVHVYI